MILLRLLWRGFTRRCPVCGHGRLFRRWLTMVDTCPRCGLRFERIDGHLTGALGINTVISIVVVVTVGVIAGILTYPELPLAPLVTTVVLVAVIFPIFFYPFSKTVWTAVDLRIRPPEPNEVSDGQGDWIHH